MLIANAGRFVHVTAYLSVLEWTALRVGSGNATDTESFLLERELKTGRLKETLTGLRSECVALGLNGMVGHLDTFMPLVPDRIDPLVLEEALRSTNLRLREDLGKHVFL